MRVINVLPVLLCSLIWSGCSVMHFKNGSLKAEGDPKQQWHHDVALSLVEISKPVYLDSLCGGKGSDWSRVTTQDDAVTAIVGGLDQMLTGLLLIPIDIWDPQLVTYTCGGRTRKATAAPVKPVEKVPSATPASTPNPAPSPKKKK